jgi:hypothetical protein
MRQLINSKKVVLSFMLLLRIHTLLQELFVNELESLEIKLF